MDAISGVQVKPMQNESSAGSPAWVINHSGSVTAVSSATIISPAPREAWNEVVQTDANTLVSQTPGWTDVMCAAGHAADASRYYELPDGQRMILPLVRLSGPLPRFASPPAAWGFGGLLSAMPLRASDIEVVFEDLSRLPAAQITVRPNPLDAGVWQAGAPAVAIAIPRRAHVVDLTGGFEAVVKRFDTQAKRSIRKAEREGVTVEYDTSSKFVPEFYELFKMSLVRWADKQHEPAWLSHWRGTRRDPIDKFIQMSERMNGECRWYVARAAGQTIAACLVLMGKNAHYTRGVMNRDLATNGANFLLQRTILEDACKNGCRWYHMGETGHSESLSKFKEHFGALPYAYAEYRVEHLPITKTDRAVRSAVKRIIGFKDA
jgi:hypothetical protein